MINDTQQHEARANLLKAEGRAWVHYLTFKGKSRMKATLLSGHGKPLASARFGRF